MAVCARVCDCVLYVFVCMRIGAEEVCVRVCWGSACVCTRGFCVQQWAVINRRHRSLLSLFFLLLLLSLSLFLLLLYCQHRGCPYCSPLFIYFTSIVGAHEVSRIDGCVFALQVGETNVEIHLVCVCLCVCVCVCVSVCVCACVRATDTYSHFKWWKLTLKFA
jgi:hypothetical protein